MNPENSRKNNRLHETFSHFTLIIHSAVKNLLFIPNHFDATWSSQKTTELNNLTRILLARAYPLYQIIKNIKTPWPTTAITCCPKEHRRQKPKFPPLYFLPLTLAKYSWQLYIRISTQLLMTPHSPLFDHPNHYQFIPILAAFTTILSTLHEHMAPHSRISNTNTPTHPHTPIQTYPQWYTHVDVTLVVTFLSSSIPDTPN